MITENISTLKIHKLTKEQYERELAAGRIDENALYLTPDESNSDYVDLDSDQTVAGVKTFSNGIKLGNATLNYSEDENALVISFE